MDLFQSPGIVTTDGFWGSIPLLVPNKYAGWCNGSVPARDNMDDKFR